MHHNYTRNSHKYKNNTSNTPLEWSEVLPTRGKRDLIIQFSDTIFINLKNKWQSGFKPHESQIRIDVYETLCPQQMHVHKGGQIKNWGGECRDVTPTKLQCQNIRRALQVFSPKNNKITIIIKK